MEGKTLIGSIEPISGQNFRSNVRAPEQMVGTRIPVAPALLSLGYLVLTVHQKMPRQLFVDTEHCFIYSRRSGKLGRQQECVPNRNSGFIPPVKQLIQGHQQRHTFTNQIRTGPLKPGPVAEQGS